MGMIAIGAGGLDVAVSMATGKYYVQCPSVLQVKLTGRKAPCICKRCYLKNFTGIISKRWVNKIVEYTGEGLNDLPY